jgi:transcriptional regulator with XRE-family HTH domain
MPSKHFDPIDRLIGRNIRLHRMQKRMSQTELADNLGITFQQVQKYEKAANRVSASRLFHIARVLGIPVSALYDGTGTGSENPLA